jgi:hypothetical protein
LFRASSCCSSTRGDELQAESDSEVVYSLDAQQLFWLCDDPLSAAGRWREGECCPMATLQYDSREQSYVYLVLMSVTNFRLQLWPRRASACFSATSQRASNLSMGFEIPPALTDVSSQVEDRKHAFTTHIWFGNFSLFYVVE